MNSTHVYDNRMTIMSFPDDEKFERMKAVDMRVSIIAFV